MPSTATNDPALDAAIQEAEIGALTAGATFGAALRATPEFTALLETGNALDADLVAQAAIHAYNEKREDLRVEAAMNLLTTEQSDEIGRLLDEMYAVPAVIAYVAATAAFADLCRETSAVVSGLIGIDFAANSRSGGCCGG
jgi:cell fate (sporulation/competence/biofilm development) regulator YlbF (YheA/YmcA/DUF963 family)